MYRTLHLKVRSLRALSIRGNRLIRVKRTARLIERCDWDGARDLGERGALQGNRGSDCKSLRGNLLGDFRTS